MKNWFLKTSLPLLILTLIAPYAAIAGDNLPESRNVKVDPLSRPETPGRATNFSWDGRLVFTFDTQNPLSGNFAVQVFRPEMVTMSDGRPQFGDESFSQATHLGRAHEGENYLKHGFFTSIAIAPNHGGPAWPEKPLINPFRSDNQGNYQPDGSSETYRFFIYGHYLLNFKEKPEKDLIYRASGTIVVRAPRTAKAEIIHAALGPFQQVLAGSQPLFGLEPTITFDGKLLVWAGFDNNEIYVPGTQNEFKNHIVYSYNDNPENISGWSMPKTIAAMHEDANVKNQYPLAFAQLKDMVGTLYEKENRIYGNYPWITLDGSDVLFGTTHGHRAGFSALGRMTGHRIKLLDGDLNPDRETTQRQLVQGLGQKLGMWKIGRDIYRLRHPDTSGEPAKSVLPYTADDHVLALYDNNRVEYFELGFDDYMDGDHQLVLHMREVLDRTPSSGESDNRHVYIYDTTQTADASRYGNHGVLNNYVAYSQEYRAQTGDTSEPVDRDEGFVGNSMYFKGGGVISIPLTHSAANDAYNDLDNGLSFNVQIKRLMPFTSNVYVARKNSDWGLMLRKTGQVQMVLYYPEVQPDGSTRFRYVTVRFNTVVPIGVWTHLGFTISPEQPDHRRTVDLYMDGQKVESWSYDGAMGQILVGGPSNVRIGPNAGTSHTHFNDWVLQMDELYLTGSAMDEARMAKTGMRPYSEPVSQTVAVSLPNGLAKEDFQMHGAMRMDAILIALGRELFEDPRLSGDASGKNIEGSCASCHQADQAFTDGQTVANITGEPLAFNTPTIVNRLLARRFFFDGRSEDLRNVVQQPFANAKELNNSHGNIQEVLNRHYANRFTDAQGNPVAPSVEGMAEALAAYVGSIFSFDAKFDRSIARESGYALTDEEQMGFDLFYGKARCVACHEGSNFTDERFHVTGVDVDDVPENLGRGAVNGVAKDLGAFKTPTLRNLGDTATYFHNGSGRGVTRPDVGDHLKATVGFYSMPPQDAGSVQGRELGDIAPDMIRLNLTDAEKNALTAFLHTLNGRTESLEEAFNGPVQDQDYPVFGLQAESDPVLISKRADFISAVYEKLTAIPAVEATIFSGPVLSEPGLSIPTELKTEILGNWNVGGLQRGAVHRLLYDTEVIKKEMVRVDNTLDISDDIKLVPLVHLGIYTYKDMETLLAQRFEACDHPSEYEYDPTFFARMLPHFWGRAENTTANFEAAIAEFELNFYGSTICRRFDYARFARDYFMHDVRYRTQLFKRTHDLLYGTDKSGLPSSLQLANLLAANPDLTASDWVAHADFPERVFTAFLKSEAALDWFSMQ